MCQWEFEYNIISFKMYFLFVFFFIVYYSYNIHFMWLLNRDTCCLYEFFFSLSLVFLSTLFSFKYTELYISHILFHNYVFFVYPFLCVCVCSCLIFTISASWSTVSTSIWILRILATIQIIQEVIQRRFTVIRRKKKKSKVNVNLNEIVDHVMRMGVS